MTPKPIKYAGGKHYLAAKIVATFPDHTHYVEPFAGGLSVLLAKPQRGSEVVNDLDGALSNFWVVLRDPAMFDGFRRMCQATAFDEWAFEESQGVLASPDCSSERWAWAFFVVARQSLAGRGDTFSPLSRNRTRRGMNEQASAWLSAIDGLDAVHARLRSVVVLNRPALGVIRQQDGPGTLFYLDPPYLPETRTAPDVYRHEMTREQHVELLNAVCACKGRVALSGYANPLYDGVLAGWRRIDFDIANHAAGGAAKRRMTECLWTNY